MTKTKKIDVKKVAKLAISTIIANALTEAGYTVSTDSDAYGFTAGTLVVADLATDVQVKFIAPKAGVTRYEVEIDVEDTEGDESTELVEDADLEDPTEPMPTDEIISLD